MQRLIDHYVKAKTTYQEMPGGLRDKITRISLAFSHLPETATGEQIIAAARLAWPDVQANTLRRYLVQFRAVLNRAALDGLIAKAPHIDMPFVHDTVYVDISAEELTMLLRHIRMNNPRWYPLATMLSHTGARLGEVLAITREDLLTRGIRIRKPVGRRSKTVERVIPYTGRTAEIKEFWLTVENFSLLPKGIAAGSAASCLGRAIDEAVAALGLPPLRVHDLRHAFASVIAEMGGELADIATLLGHSNLAMSVRYRGLVRSRSAGLMTAMT